jgi:transposase
MPSNGKRNTPKQQAIAERRLIVSNLYRRGMLQVEIAKQLGVVQSVISVDLKALRKDWMDKANANFASKQAETLAKIDHLELVAWQDYETSKGERTETQTRASGDYKQASIKKVQRDGNVEFLRIVQWCISERCKILGLYAPVRNEHGGVGGGPIRTEGKMEHDFSRLTLEEMIALRSMVERTYVEPALST